MNSKPTKITAVLLFSLTLSSMIIFASTSASEAQSGIASVYSLAGRRTASGAIADPSRMAAAHKTLPFGTIVRVTNRQNGRAVNVRIVDRGPFVRGRVIDLTPAAARQLGFSGLAPVSLSPGA